MSSSKRNEEVWLKIRVGIFLFSNLHLIRYLFEISHAYMYFNAVITDLAIEKPKNIIFEVKTWKKYVFK